MTNNNNHFLLMGPVRQHCCLCSWACSYDWELGGCWLSQGWTGWGIKLANWILLHVCFHPPGGQPGCVLRRDRDAREQMEAHKAPLKNWVQSCCIINPGIIVFSKSSPIAKTLEAEGKAPSGQKAWIKRGEKFGPFLQPTTEIIEPWTLLEMSSERVSNLLLG